MPNPHPQSELPPVLASDICAAFNLGEPLDSKRISSGLMHTNYFLDTGAGNYVARLLSYVDQNTLANERHVQAQLRQNDIPAPYMLTANTGGVLHTTPDHSVTVAARLAGTHPSRPAADPDCFVVGQVLGKFHQAVSSLPHNNERYALLGHNSTVYRTIKLEERGSVAAPELRRLHAEHSNTAFAAGLPRGVLHGDFHSENVLINDGTAAVLDLETAIQGPLVLDIGRALIDLCPQVDGTGIDPQKMNHFLQGYTEVRPLTGQEEDALPSVIAFACVGVASWLYLKKYDMIGEFFLKIGTSIKNT